MTIPYQRFSTAYRSHLQVSRNPRKTWISWHLKVAPIGCAETLVRNYHSKLVISKKRTDVNYMAMEAWNLAASSSTNKTGPTMKGFIYIIIYFIIYLLILLFNYFVIYSIYLFQCFFVYFIIYLFHYLFTYFITNLFHYPFICMSVTFLRSAGWKLPSRQALKESWQWQYGVTLKTLLPACPSLTLYHLYFSQRPKQV
jgi:hypothetical protein